MIRGLLPVKLVNPGDSVSDCFVSFHVLPDAFSSTNEGDKDAVWTLSGNSIPLINKHCNNFQQKNDRLSLGYGDMSLRIMYVCGTVAAGSTARDSSQADGQPRFFTTAHLTKNLIKDNITITYNSASNPKGLEQKP